ncbi:MAG: DUF5057 domain-containing protein [Bacteroides sp.]|nr:DUF5057 domain-containing protein [Bacteroides sp.]MCM1548601.1 DUF5057 domain-containing protein [Clostridium sp.]
MLKTKKSKIIIGAVAILAVLAASSIWVMSTVKSNSVDDFGYEALAQPGAATATLTQLDRIIQDSHREADDPEGIYKVYIITPGGEDISVVRDFFQADDRFRNYIVNDNRTIDDEMNPGKVVVTPLTVGQLNGMTAEAIATELGNADLIYLYAKTKQSYDGGNAIGEDLYNYLHNYAFGLNKPLIMNYAGLDAGNDENVTQPDIPSNTNTDSNVFQLTTVTFKNSWKRTNTTNVSKWKNDTTTTDLEDILTSHFGQSLYIPYRITNTPPTGFTSWEEYWKRNSIDTDGDGEIDSVLNILYIHDDTADVSNEKTIIENVGNWMLTDGRDGRAFSTVSYNYLPTVANVELQSAEALTVADFYNDAGTSKYDYIFIAPDTYSTGHDLQPEVMDVLSDLSKQKIYILFGTLAEQKQTTNPGGNTGTSSGLDFDVTTNYGKLLDLSITTSGYAKKNNIMVVGVEYMNILANAPEKNPTKVAQLVALINKSTYRTHAGSGSGGGSGSISTTAYRVLELQPCYPIDLVLARGITDKTALGGFTFGQGSGTPSNVGNYYTIPANVLNTNEIDNYLDENGNIASEYYQWDLSKAKISYALNMQGYSGITTDQIDLVQMSTEEYITAKADVSDAYDLIYIGGNMSALRSSSTYGVVNWGLNNSASTYKTAFSMYSHNNSELITWPNHNRLTVDSNYAIALANDITYDRLVELKKYIDAGMPIVFSNEVWDAYEKAVAQKYKNKYMDPDSNMFKLCAYAEAAKKKEGNTSVLTDWQVRESYNEKMNYAANSADYKFFEDYFVSVETRVENANGIYGTTDMVTVFGTDDDNWTLSWQLWSCINGANTNHRPKFAMTTTAISYVEGDTSTELTGRDVTWDISLLANDPTHKYTAYILEDVDDNGVFDITGEQVASQALVAGEASLSYSYPKSDFGAFYWKILIVDESNGSSASYSDITVFKRLEEQPKKSATVLEIMEMSQSMCSSSNPTSPDSHTFYLDTNYQQSSGNPFLYSSFDPERGAGAYDEYGWAPFPNDYNADNPADSGPVAAYSSNRIGWATKTGMGGGLGNYTFGKYQPSLSIGRYDATTNLEDRAYNYMSLVADDYDFTLDIMYMDDIQYFSEKAHKLTEEERAANLAMAEKAKENYDAYLTEGSVSYNELKKVEDVLIECLNTLKAGSDYTCANGTVIRAADFNLYDIDNIMESKNYFRIFFLNNDGFKGAAEGDNLTNSFYAFYKLVYTPYTKINDIKIKYYREYRYYSMLAYGPKEYLAKNYDVIVVGFSDPYEANKITPFSEVEAKDLQDFATAGGSLLLTHDVITKSNAAKLNTTGEYLRDFAGQNAFAGLTADAGTGSTGYAKYSSLDKDRYFITNLSAIDGVNLGPASDLSGGAWDTAVTTWSNQSQVGVRGGSYTSYDYSSWPATSTEVYNGISLTGLSEMYNLYRTSGSFALRYKYAEAEIENVITYNIQVTGPLNVSGTTRAEAVNRGVVTTYPFYIATDLRVSATHPQSYALDLENKNVTVWYTLAPDNKKADGSAAIAGKDSGSYDLMKQNSSLMAASPKDGADNYYIYSIGNVTYCGAGQALITGYKRDNNDERRLFLNVLLHMAKVRDGVEKKPEIVLYDPDGTTKAPGNVVKRDAENDYYIEVLSDVTYPEFAFGLENLPAKVKDVEVFYDLDYSAGMENPDVALEDEYHVPIPFPNKDEVIGILNSKDGVYIMSKENHPALVTKKDYFNGKNNLYSGKYTYIVVRITLDDGKNTVLTRRIKILLTHNLLDLT